MGRKHMDVRGIPPGSIDYAPIVHHLREGGVLVYPTETVYGVGGIPRPSVVERIQELKGREETKPFIVLVADDSSESGLRWTDEARQLAGLFWPGALTLVLEDPDGYFPLGVRSEAGTVAVRATPHPIASRLVALLHEPLISTSANRSGHPPARSGHEALQMVEENAVSEDVWILDSGALPPSAPSTIVDCTGIRPTVVREGSIPVARLRCLFPGIDVLVS